MGFFILFDDSALERSVSRLWVGYEEFDFGVGGYLYWLFVWMYLRKRLCVGVVWCGVVLEGLGTYLVVDPHMLDEGKGGLHLV